MVSNSTNRIPKESQILSNSVDLSAITDAILQALDARSKDIITRRYGLKSNVSETLESIGKEYGITRERVRQIEANAKKSLSSLEETLRPVHELFIRIFTMYGGALTEEHIVEIAQQESSSQVTSHMLHFHLDIYPHMRYVGESELFAPHWQLDDLTKSHANEIVAHAVELLKKEKHPQPLARLMSDIQSKFSDPTEQPSKEHIIAALTASKHVSRTAFGDWGLSGWSETSPRGVGDKSYSVLRRHGKPAHFREITNMINETKFDHKVANPQTVHNELIKDKRFVLVGRGLYGLKEWGFMSGTVADVLESILKKAEQPLTKEELVTKVLKQRIVKKNTILLSLQNNQRFVKTGENRYTLKDVG